MLIAGYEEHTSRTDFTQKRNYQQNSNCSYLHKEHDCWLIICIAVLSHSFNANRKPVRSGSNMHFTSPEYRHRYFGVP